MPRRSANPAPEFRWNEGAGRYTQNGRFVPQKTVRGALDTALDRSSENVRRITERLRAGEISVKDWQLQMVPEMRSAHLAAHALAKGGWAQMSPADFGRVGQRLRGEYRFLAGFADQVLDGRQRLDGTLARRAQMYIESARSGYHEQERREKQLRGATEERNLLAPSDHCPGCLDADAMGWVPIGTLPPVGSRDCRSRCRCRVAYR